MQLPFDLIKIIYQYVPFKLATFYNVFSTYPNRDNFINKCFTNQLISRLKLTPIQVDELLQFLLDTGSVISGGIVNDIIVGTYTLHYNKQNYHYQYYQGIERKEKYNYITIYTLRKNKNMILNDVKFLNLINDDYIDYYDKYFYVEDENNIYRKYYDHVIRISFIDTEIKAYLFDTIEFDFLKVYFDGAKLTFYNIDSVITKSCDISESNLDITKTSIDYYNNKGYHIAGFQEYFENKLIHKLENIDTIFEDPPYIQKYDQQTNENNSHKFIDYCEEHRDKWHHTETQPTLNRCIFIIAKNLSLRLNRAMPCVH